MEYVWIMSKTISFVMNIRTISSVHNRFKLWTLDIFLLMLTFGLNIELLYEGLFDAWKNRLQNRDEIYNHITHPKMQAKTPYV